MIQLISTQLKGIFFSFLVPESKKTVFQKFISGKIINSVVDSNKKQELIEWKQKIAKSIFDPLNGILSSNEHYAISLSMQFAPKLHGNAKLDVENYVKPIVDGIAAGLFCPKDQDPLQIIKFNYDDSNFNKLFIERLNDCESKDEGIIISISIL
jgi:hypothetical protein